MLSKRVTITILLLVVFSMGQVAFGCGDVYIEFVIYDGCSATTAQIDYSIEYSNASYKVDNDGAGSTDVSVDLKIHRDGSVDDDWTCWFGDDTVTSYFQVWWMFAALAWHSEDICIVTSMAFGGRTPDGVTNGYGGKEIILSEGIGPYPGILAHEVGHSAGLYDVVFVDPDTKNRVMVQYSNVGFLDEVLESERSALEALGGHF